MRFIVSKRVSEKFNFGSFSGKILMKNKEKFRIKPDFDG